MRARKGLFGFILPGLILYGLFFIYPTGRTLYYSFTDWDGVSFEWNWVGVEHYIRAFTQDIVLHQALANNVKFLLFVVVFQTLLSLLFAIYLVKNTKLNIFLRALFFFPTVLSSVSVAFIWSFIYDPSLGLLNRLLTDWGLGMWKHAWLGDAETAIYSLAFVQVWFHTGQMLVIFVAGLQGIPAELLEAAQVEGATRWQRFRHVIWPLIAPAATIVVAYTTLQSFKAFDLVFAMTRGGPNHATEILATHIYHIAFRSYQFGYASAVSVLFLLLVGTLTFIQFRLLRADRIQY